MSSDTRLLILGLDGATFEVLDKLRKQVACPNLEELIDTGARGILDSTRPIATLPAWTSFLTTASPAHHGIADIFLRLPGSNRIEPASGLHRGGPTWLLNLANQGLKVGCFGFPGTYPAENHANLVQVSGFDTPDAKASGRGISPALLRETIDALGGWHFSILPEDRRGGIDPDECADALIDDLKLKTRIIKEVEKNQHFDVLAWHIQPSDTIAHHGWASWDRQSPRASSYPESDAFQRVFKAVDEAIAEVRQSFQPTHIMMVSDHGFGGAGQFAFYLNRFLEKEKYLSFPKASRSQAWLRKAAFGAGNQVRAHFPKFSKRALGTLSKLLHPSLFAGLRGQAFSPSDAIAFSDELDYAPSVWLNRKSHFQNGTLSDEEADSYLDEIASKLRRVTTPDGVPLFDHVWTRPTAKRFSNRLPDIVLEPSFINGYRTSFLSSSGPGPVYRKLENRELRAGRGYGMPGVHHADGVLILRGQGWPCADLPKLGIADAGAIALGLYGVPVPAWSDWQPPADLQELDIWPPQVSQSDSTLPDSSGAADYRMPQEVWERLKQWGYVN